MRCALDETPGGQAIALGPSFEQAEIGCEGLPGNQDRDLPVDLGAAGRFRLDRDTFHLDDDFLLVQAMRTGRPDDLSLSPAASSRFHGGMEAPRVVHLSAQRTGEAGRLLAAAFDDYPMFRYLWPKDRRRERVVTSIQRAQAAIATDLGSAWCYMGSGRVLGAAFWLAPNARKGLTHTLREARSMAPSLTSPRSLLRAARIFTALDRERPAEPHWYLEVIGVAPDAQGRGVGRELLELGLAKADAARVPAFLETSDMANLGWYGRFGFEVVRQVRPIAEAPASWTMVRPPR